MEVKDLNIIDIDILKTLKAKVHPNMNIWGYSLPYYEMDYKDNYKVFFAQYDFNKRLPDKLSSKLVYFEVSKRKCHLGGCLGRIPLELMKDSKAVYKFIDKLIQTINYNLKEVKNDK